MPRAQAGPICPVTVYLIEDDTSVRCALTRLMRSAGLDSAAFASVDEFLRSDVDQERACIVADVHIGGVDACNLPAELHKRSVDLPVIFITADYTNEMRQRIRRAGGRGFFRKPIDDQALLDTIRWVIDNNR